jgi:tryptophan synthase alpha chain
VSLPAPLAGASRIASAFARAAAEDRAAFIPFLTAGDPDPDVTIETAIELERAGFDGVLMTDLPPEEAAGYRPAWRKAGLDTIFLVSPTSPPRRMLAAGRLSTGFLYVVSRSGITGARTSMAPELARTCARARRAAPRLPRAIGFGISTPEAARLAAGLAECVVVGSALVRAGEEAVLAGKDPAAAIARLAGNLAAACSRSGPGRRRSA